MGDSEKNGVVFTNATPGEYTIIHRIGQAQPIEVLRPSIINAHGVITAPLEFYKVRKEMKMPDGSPYFPLTHTAVYIERAAGKMTLKWGKTLEETQTIHGEIKYANIFSELGINNPGKTYTPKELADTLRRHRFLFADKGEGMKIIAELQSFQAKVNTSIVQSNDNRGTSKNLVENSIETNIPVSIPVKMVIFKGFSAEAFTVDILFCVKNQSVECWLDSADAAYWAEKQKEEMIDVLLQDFITDGIAVIES